ncbi:MULTISPECIES: MFS transporter [Gammaproteobacteria]|uniref:Major facilitator superfamily (MFS) profile domain-containing protein n=14 Tax=Gammaproteobacteria TaxID=1236 RepID=A0A899NMN9_PROST|nr:MULTISPECIES: MFS transporter [Enterobacterales]AVI43907.1 hypothetical protein [Proteus penneri]EHZ7765697.1 MFS transporter [Providencia rettgeri]EIJ7168839.1 MFS transporter [Providencia rettgeri]EJD6049388.1 MFS transporter [Providencia rettgeri]EJD6049827.1 MFS transporter [Providencia rettgeri]
MSSYFRFMSQEWPLLSFGFITVFIGNIGQSFFLSWYGADIQQSLNISAEDYGFIYAIATLCSSAVIFMVGGLVDRWALHKVVIVVSFLLCVSCLLMANIQTVWMLFFAFWGLRLAGQGLFPHTAQTTMLRVYTHQRGKALSLSASGVAFGEMVLPIILMTTIALLGWRWSWLMLALIVMIIYLPMALTLLKKSNTSDKKKPLEPKSTKTQEQGRRDVVKDWRFWSIIPAVLSAPFIVTAVFIQQNYLLEQKGWPASLLASSFVAYGFLHWASSMVSGSLIDRFQAKSLLPFLPLPLIAGLLVLTLLDNYWAAPLFMSLFGLGIGSSSPVISALWVEIYGTQHIGAIRSMVTSMMIFSTAAAPWIFGIFIEKGWTASTLFGLFSGLTMIGLLLLIPAYQSFKDKQCHSD